mmetsp:Transcript_5304/g.9178  ORF Transcript_5304/g.9178 Transcript_5304/m.9178 type:complete len:157 (-) Transcript_5304:324-794(-)
MQCSQLHGNGWLRSQKAGQTTSSCSAQANLCGRLRSRASLVVRAERKEYYDYKDMPPLPLTVARIHIPKLGYTVVDKGSEETRMASLAIFYDLFKDDQYSCKLNRKSSITALCMYDRDDVAEAEQKPGTFPNIDLLQRVYNEGMELQFVVEEFAPR